MERRFWRNFRFYAAFYAGVFAGGRRFGFGRRRRGLARRTKKNTAKLSAAVLFLRNIPFFIKK